jgi:hypothetical protein
VSKDLENQLSADAGILPSESWEVALNYSGLLGIVPSSFSSVIRSLLLDQQKNNGKLSPSTRFMIERLVKSRSLKAALYFGALTFLNDEIKDKPYLNERDLVNLYSPAELAAIVGLSYLFKRARKLCDPAQFTMITNRFQECADIGGHIGFAIPKLSAFVGIITGAMPYLGLAPFLFYDRRGFIDYTRHLKHTKQSLDLNYELRRWSCSSVQIASVMLQALGLGIGTASAFSTGLTAETTQIIETTPDADRYHLATLWLKSLEEVGAEPKMTHKAEFYPTKAAMGVLLAKMLELREKGSPHCWLLRGAFDISPKNTPQLFSADSIQQDALSSQIDLASAELDQASRAVAEVEADLKDVLSEDS